MPTARVTWVDPLTLVSNVPIPAGDFADVEVFMSVDNGQNYVNVGHAAPGQLHFDQEVTDPGTYLFKLESKDTQNPSTLGPDSVVVSVTVPAPALAPISAPTNVAAALV